MPGSAPQHKPAAPARAPAGPAHRSPAPSRRSSGGASPAVAAAPPPLRLSGSASGPLPGGLSSQVADTLRSPGPGAPLPSAVSAPIGGSLGVDVSPVRVHTGPRAAQAADGLQARAFTWGPNIFLGSGQQPSDLRLMAHEVTHVVQQQSGPALQLFSPASGATFEREAHAVSSAVLSGRPARVTHRTGGPAIQRDLVPGFLRRAASAVVSGVSAVASAAGVLLAAARDRALRYVQERASSIPGYPLLAFVLGRDPITQVPVERNATNLIQALLQLVPGGQQLYDNLMQAQVIQRAYQWLSAELGGLGLTWEFIRGLFQRAWDSLSLADLGNLAGVFERLRNIFGPTLSRLANFAIRAGRKILEFVFEGALALGGAGAQRLLGMFRRVSATFSLIVNDPVRFLTNLLNAVKGGFRRFADNILDHLRTALFEWLFGALQGAGLTLPTRWDFMGILGLVLQVLGLTYARMRERLVRLIGAPAVTVIERGFEFPRIIVTQGLAAAWQKILEFATGLIDTVIEGIRNWVITSIVRAAVTRLATMFNPVGAIINAIITIYNTVMFFIERAQQIMALIESITESISNIATGNIGGAVAYIERTLARTLTVIISFLARLLGLGGISDTIRNIIRRIQATVDRAIDRMIAWIRQRAAGLLARMGVGGADGQSSANRVDQALTAAQAVVNRYAGRRVGGMVLRPLLAAIKLRYRLTLLEIVPRGQIWAVRGAASPIEEVPTNAKTEEGESAAGAGGGQPSIPVGSEVLFPDAAGSANQKTGRVIEVTQVGGVWFIKYRPRHYTESTSIMLRAYKEDGTRAYRTTTPGSVSIQVDRTSPGNSRHPTGSVAFRPLVWTDYDPPGSGNPVGWSRLASNADWVRGHIVNGKWGGPGGRLGEWNLISIPRVINDQMSNRHERFLHPIVRQGDLVWFSATIQYHQSDPANQIGTPSDFPSQITIRSYTAVDQGGNISQGAPLGSPYQYGPIRLPDPSELLPNRRRS